MREGLMTEAFPNEAALQLSELHDDCALEVAIGRHRTHDSRWPSRAFQTPATPSMALSLEDSTKWRARFQAGPLKRRHHLA